MSRGNSDDGRDVWIELHFEIIRWKTKTEKAESLCELNGLEKSIWHYLHRSTVLGAKKV